MKHFIFLAALCIGLVAQVHYVSAYFSNNQDAVLLSDGGALFAVSYSFGSDRYAYEMPLFVNRVTASSAADISLEYQLVDDNNQILESGVTAGIVLSNAQLSADRYVIDRGTARQMMLLVLFKPATTSPSVSDVRLQVTSLPFVMIEDGIKTNGQLNPTELEKYQTPMVGKI